MKWVGLWRIGRGCHEVGGAISISILCCLLRTLYKYCVLSADFEDFLVTVSYLMEQNSGCRLWMTYQERRCVHASSVLCCAKDDTNLLCE